MKPVPSTDMIRRFDVSGPRYTSYPTADRFVEAFDDRSLMRWLGMPAGATVPRDLSVYVHIPFCASVCYYCACNKIVTKKHDKVPAYIEDLKKEMALYADATYATRPISQLHFGGGTPTFLDDDELESLLLELARLFGFANGAERSIEIDPRTVDRARLERLARIGFNRISFGVQDFDRDVQKAVHRMQSTESVFELVAAARALEFESINVDLIYGLPRQTPESFAATIDTLVKLRPDRVAIYGYAHLPERFKPQRRIIPIELPMPSAKLQMQSDAILAMERAGYVYIGMDHFALPDDPLAVALSSGLLHRNFMGYTTMPDSDMIGLGVSAIGSIGASYAQNHRSIEPWHEAIAAGRLPICRGLELSADDLLRRAIIMAIMCNGEVDFDTLQTGFLVDPRAHFAREIEGLAEFERMGMLKIDDQRITVSDLGRYFLRPIAMSFDRYLQNANRAKFSRVL